MSNKTYNPALFEDKWYQFWLEKGYFHANADNVLSGKKKKFSVVLPPPNVTGVLHIGHALNSTLQDIMCRWKRMKGYEVCWVPGTDHAGIATQWVVERQLAKEGLTRNDIGRDEFIKRVWQWKGVYGNRIIDQLKKLGASCDWERQRFTMDEGFSKAVRKAFVTLYREGLIYKGKRLINWCPRCHTALSDLEVEYSEDDGYLWFIRYPIVNSSESIIVATTRPETMLGDTAVAVNPKDERYKSLVGKEAILPIVNRKIPIVADEYVDPEFGTGAVKITPAHDFNDFEVGRRHDLPIIPVMDDFARITVEPFKGMDRFEARKAIVERLKATNYLERVLPYKHSVGHCYRCKTVVEPYLSDQWFVRVKPLAERAVKAVRDESIRFIPKQWENTFFEWMRNIKDWCISRQIWWGHRIPAWYCEDCGHITVSEKTPERCENCGSTNIHQDEDVLDTWFSSAMWPFGTLGWPEKTKDLEAFYPTSLLVTGFDIIFFWVSRMMMMGYHFMDEKPFSDVYIHALVRDESGQKMSKTKGNVIDPLVMIEKYGADTLRFTLTALAAQGRDIRLSEATIEGYRHFSNKIWNIARFILKATESIKPIEHEYTVEDRWILTKLSKVCHEVDRNLGNYRFNDAAKAIYQFIWGEFADWFIEFSKERIYKGSKQERETTLSVLLTILINSLKLLHPVMPFLTEEIYQKLPNRDAESIAISPWPNLSYDFANEEKSVDVVREIVKGVRNVKYDLNIPSSKINVGIKASENIKGTIRSLEPSIKRLAGIDKIYTDRFNKEKSVSFFLKNVEVYVDVGNVVNIADELQRQSKKLKKLSIEAGKLEKKFSNKGFLEKAPKNVIEKDRAKLQDIRKIMEKLSGTISQLKSMNL